MLKKFVVEHAFVEPRQQKKQQLNLLAVNNKLASPDECQGIWGSAVGYTTPVACIHPSESSALWKKTFLSCESEWRVSIQNFKLQQWHNGHLTLSGLSS